MNNQTASLCLSITVLLASSLLQTTVARATDIKPTELSKVCSSEVISNPITDKLDGADSAPDKFDGTTSVAKPVTGKVDGAELELSKASDAFNPKLMQKPGKGQHQLCS